MEMFLDVICDTAVDGIRLLPFLFLAYLAMECLEHWTGGKMQAVVRKSGKAGPAIGGILGIFPQCGFSAAAANLYAGRIITLGTLIAVFLSTSDEMLPIMISENVGVSMIGKILLVKSNHTWKIFLYIIVVSLALNFVIALIGEEALAAVVLDRPVFSLFASAIVGMIPNCASSVVLTQLYLGGVLSAGALMAGLLSGSGVGFLVLLRVNGDRKENLWIFGILYVMGVCGGALIQLLGVRF